MTGTDLCVNKPHCAAAVRPWESKPQPPPSLLLGLEPVQSCLGVARVMSNYGYKKKNQSRSYLNHLVYGFCGRQSVDVIFCSSISLSAVFRSIITPFLLTRLHLSTVLQLYSCFLFSINWERANMRVFTQHFCQCWHLLRLQYICGRW